MFDSEFDGEEVNEAMDMNGEGDIEEPQQYCDLPPLAPFAADDFMIKTAQHLFASRRSAIQITRRGGSFKSGANIVADKWHAWWHGCLALTDDPQVKLAALIREHTLSAEEAELFVALVANQLGLIGDENVRQCNRLIAFLGAEWTGGLEYLRALGEDSKLYRQKILVFCAIDDDLPERELLVDPTIVEHVLVGNRPERIQHGWPVTSEEELQKHLMALTIEMRRRSNLIRHASGRGMGIGMGPLLSTNQKMRRLFGGFRDTLREHPDWKMNGIYTVPTLVHDEELLILLALAGRELGHLPADDELFTGAGLLRAICQFPHEIDSNRQMFRSDSALFTNALIQPATGAATQIGGDDDFMEMEFELSQKSRDILGIERRLIKGRNGMFHVRESQLPMDRLVLSPSTRDELKMAIAQVRHAGMMLNEWGLASMFPYGRGVTILFAGPPGTGKTACAEALAHELQIPILTADYSQILNCFVGNTEKAIARIFADARAHGALLFWDEADSMFYNRDMAQRQYEVQFANALLTELERFEGVCILATNRKTTLDPALERRISLKIDFNRPNREERLAIWRHLLPQELPLAEDVDLHALAEADLSGGEIKNVILNATRMALSERSVGPVTNADFTKAARLEKEGRLKSGKPMIGFAQ